MTDSNGGGSHRHEHVRIVKVPESKKWKYISFVLFALLIVGAFRESLQLNKSSPDIVADKAIDYINDNMLDSGEASLIEVNEITGLYLLKLDINGLDYESYASKDGSLFFPSAIDLNKAPSINQAAQADTRQPRAQQQAPSRVSTSTEGEPSIGPEDAPVTILVFSDFQCPFCARVLPAVERVLEEYKGQVRIIFKQFPLSFHPNAQKAAEASECAFEQGKFWEYHDILFENANALAPSDLKQYAKDIGLDSATFDGCLDSGKYEAEVKQDLADGKAAGVSGTPAFLINGIPVVGAQPFSSFASVIDSELDV